MGHDVEGSEEDQSHNAIDDGPGHYQKKTKLQKGN